jgi:hypothetical protein
MHPLPRKNLRQLLPSSLTIFSSPLLSGPPVPLRHFTRTIITSAWQWQVFYSLSKKNDQEQRSGELGIHSGPWPQGIRNRQSSALMNYSYNRPVFGWFPGFSGARVMAHQYSAKR